MTLSFEIAKKMPRAVKGAPGLSLRSLHMDAAAGEAVMVLLADSYDTVRAQLTNFPLRHRMQGKALTIFEGAALGSCGEQLFAFAAALPFNTEEALDVCEFLALPDKPFAIDSVELAGTSFTVKAHAELPETEQETAVDEAADAAEANTAAEAFYDSISELLARYNMGVIKAQE